MNFDAIRERSEARKAEVFKHFEQVKRRYSEAQSTMQPLIAYLKDIRKALSTDLTPEGLKAMKGASENANGNGNAGHEYGTGLTAEERWAIIEYLKAH